jgi:hypothetical protein
MVKTLSVSHSVFSRTLIEAVLTAYSLPTISSKPFLLKFKTNFEKYF